MRAMAHAHTKDRGRGKVDQKDHENRYKGGTKEGATVDREVSSSLQLPSSVVLSFAELFYERRVVWTIMSQIW